ncbi:hypothetical protein [Shigella dysenteriae]
MPGERKQRLHFHRFMLRVHEANCLTGADRSAGNYCRSL